MADDLVCKHDLSDQDCAWADGLCALCLRDRIEALERMVQAADAWRKERTMIGVEMMMSQQESAAMRKFDAARAELEKK